MARVAPRTGTTTANDLEAWLERALRTPHPRADPEPVVHDLD